MSAYDPVLMAVLRVREPLGANELNALTYDGADVEGWLVTRARFTPDEAAAIAPRLKAALLQMTPRGA